MTKLHLRRPFRSASQRIILVVAVVAAVATTAGGYAAASTGRPQHNSASTAQRTNRDLEPCNLNAPHCQHIGLTDSWFDGHIINLNYSHQYFCGDHKLSRASTGCEIGAATKVRPPSGAVVSPIYVMTPIGFRPPGLQCPVAGNCIDHPHRVDASRVFGPSAKNGLVPPHSHIIVDREGALSSWWPVIVIGVTNRQAWAEIAENKNLATVNRLRRQHPSWVTPNIPSNIYLFFQAVPGGDNDRSAS